MREEPHDLGVFEPKVMFTLESRWNSPKETGMINITEAASAKVRELLDEQGKPDHALRVFVRGMSCSGPAYGMALDDEPRPDDQVEELGGIRLLVDSRSAPYLDGAQVDYVDSLMGRGFTVANPNLAQASSGGCGSGCGCAH
jgi:iron-sulfur cluster assembly accessory protein